MANTTSQRTATLATIGVVAVLVGTGFVAQQVGAATKTITGRGIVQTGSGADSIPVFFTVTSPNDEKVNGEKGELKTANAKIYKNEGQTDPGKPLKAVKRKRLRSQNVDASTEVVFKGTYTVGDPGSVRPDVVYVTDRSYVICGTLEGITRRTAAGASSNTIVINTQKRTVQEKRIESFFPLKEDRTLSFGDGTQFHNANGSWKNPKNRVSIQAADITASQQKTAVRGKITGTNTYETTTVDLGVKCD